jgi:hypothetical protein
MHILFSFFLFFVTFFNTWTNASLESPLSDEESRQKEGKSSWSFACNMLSLEFFNPLNLLESFRGEDFASGNLTWKMPI